MSEVQKSNLDLEQKKSTGPNIIDKIQGLNNVEGLVEIGRELYVKTPNALYPLIRSLKKVGYTISSRTLLETRGKPPECKEGAYGLHDYLYVLGRSNNEEDFHSTESHLPKSFTVVNSWLLRNQSLVDQIFGAGGIDPDTMQYGLNGGKEHHLAESRFEMMQQFVEHFTPLDPQEWAAMINEARKSAEVDMEIIHAIRRFCEQSLKEKNRNRLESLRR